MRWAAVRQLRVRFPPSAKQGENYLPSCRSHMVGYIELCWKRYVGRWIELTGLLQYIANQLKAKHSLDLLIVKEVRFSSKNASGYKVNTCVMVVPFDKKLRTRSLLLYRNSMKKKCLRYIRPDFGKNRRTPYVAAVSYLLLLVGWLAVAHLGPLSEYLREGVVHTLDLETACCILRVFHHCS